MNPLNCFGRRSVSGVALAMMILAGWSQVIHAQPAGIDPQAEKLLRRMSDYLAGRQQFTLKAESTLEVVLTSGQSCSTTALRRLWCRVQQAARHRKEISPTRIFYDGKTLTLYNPRGELVRDHGPRQRHSMRRWTSPGRSST